MGEFKRKIVQFLYRLFPQKELQYEKNEFDEINKEHKSIRGVKGSDKIKVAMHRERRL
jgi:hypothetical protein